MMSSKRLSGNGGFNSQPYSFKHRRLSAIRTFPENCGPHATISPKPNDARDFTFEPPSGTINKSGSEKSANNAKYAMAIPAVPLRCVPPPVSFENDSKNFVPYGKNDDGLKKGANEKENKVSSLDELWKQDSEKLAAIVEEAKSYFNAFDVKCYEKSPDLHRRSSIAEPNLEFVEQEKSARGNLIKSPLVKETSRLKNMSEDYENEVCILSPEEWSKSHVREKVNFGGNLEGISSCEPMDTKSEEEKKDHVSTKLDGCAPFEDNDPKYCGRGNQEELINLNIVKPEEPKGLKVREALRLFEKNYNELMKELKIEPKVGRKNAHIHLEAANCLKIDGKYISLEKPFGHVPGIEIGDEFQFRCHLAMIGLHRQLVSGIDHVILNGKKYANSVVDSGRYENTSKTNDVLIYSGQGGNVKTTDSLVDQKLARGNLALMNSKKMKYPIRVTYKRKSYAWPERGVVYVYDGLYIINNAWQEKDQKGKLVFRFELHRLPGQPRPHQQAESKMEVCDDISRGKEKMPIRAVNNVDDIRLHPKFSYITRMVYPDWFKKVEPVGCDCVNGCSDSHKCPCLVKNGGEIPYNENGSILRRKRRVHECGPSCKCPPTCMNRVSQRGPRHRLEIFKTELRGWGVRSRDLIPSGGFVCEYLGEFLREKEADLRVGGDEYLFDIYNSRGGRVDGFAIDAGMYGNVGRFFNHSCSPNMYAQDVLYDHADKKMPRVMFFATKDISPLEELTYDYNYKLGMVCDANGLIKTKVCYCGSRECRRRLY
ncbi:histone-lysine N-methyltransferase [Striga asiatica]|uniref:Histone-lysine N-methyltransferase n=1 Tax=Striga asiatica TaxID=4170 RepID=A0A5A7R3J4_STRAF|nr:histone-lysine N-methyltransferase [Striga asiatica]